MILIDDSLGQKRAIVNTCTQLLSLKLEFKWKLNFSFPRCPHLQGSGSEVV